MRAIVITRPGGPEVLEEREVPQPDPGPDEVRVRVAAAGLNRADVLQRKGRYPAPAGAPSEIPGLEYSGTVDGVGSRVRRWRSGDRVMGLVAGGAYAEAVVVHEREAIAVPDSLDLESAAAVPEAFITADDALFTRLELATGERLLIHAVGSGVGTAALQIAAAAGATVFGTSRTPWKLDRARELGLADGIDSSEADVADAVRKLTGGAGVDAIVDLVGGALFEASLGSLAELGRMVCVGTVSGAQAALDLSILLRRRLTLIGTVLRARPIEQKIEAARRFERRVEPLLADRRVRPVVDRVLPFSSVRDGHAALEDNATFGKVVITP